MNGKSMASSMFFQRADMSSDYARLWGTGIIQDI